MAMIFPGMDPYLENPLTWQASHSRFVVYLADELEPQLSPRYATSVNERVYVEGPTRRDFLPDVHVTTKPTARARARTSVTAVQDDVGVEIVVPRTEVKEWYVEITDLRTKRRVVAVIEVISPSNKKAGPGRKSYLRKQREVLSSQTHLVEIDFLRKGRHVAAIPRTLLAEFEPYDYFVSVNRAIGRRDRFRVYPINLRDPLPTIFIPLANGDPDARLNVRAALEQAYLRCDFRSDLPYSKACRPRLSPQDQAWANKLITAARLGRPTS